MNIYNINVKLTGDDLNTAIKETDIPAKDGNAAQDTKAECNFEIRDLIVLGKNDSFKTVEFDIDKAQDYYDRLRERMDKYLKSGVPQKLHGLIPYLLLLPDILALFIRLFKDKRITSRDKAIIVAGITYIVSPFDIIPDIVLPFGALDDLSIGFFILDKLLLNVPEDVLKENFNGKENVIGFIRNGYSYVKDLLPLTKREKIISLFNRLISKNTKQ